MPLSDISSTREPSEFKTDSGSDFHPPSDAESSTTRESFTEIGLVEPGSSRGKKRKKNNLVWKRSKSKLERNSGKSYLNSRGRIVSKKQFFHGVCSCPRKCHLLVSLEERKNIFHSFYNLSDFNLQTAYINTQVNVVNKGRHIAAQNHSKRPKTRIYSSPKESSDMMLNRYNTAGLRRNIRQDKAEILNITEGDDENMAKKKDLFLLSKQQKAHDHQLL
ncbi:unnamed protein product [Diabrotica balteata]|uniref:Uncharacterized protein n=1 Tax=Diabrotica balteata TaxID=107213 RepID=A0A9N9SUS1_DIABA|nr:unnamed protein product [Diabrotica balteata]